MVPDEEEWLLKKEIEGRSRDAARVETAGVCHWQSTQVRALPLEMSHIPSFLYSTRPSIPTHVDRSRDASSCAPGARGLYHFPGTHLHAALSRSLSPFVIASLEQPGYRPAGSRHVALLIAPPALLQPQAPRQHSSEPSVEHRSSPGLRTGSLTHVGPWGAPDLSHLPHLKAGAMDTPVLQSHEK